MVNERSMGVMGKDGKGNPKYFEKASLSITRHFFGSKISGLCTSLGLQYEATSDPPVVYTLRTTGSVF